LLLNDLYTCHDVQQGTDEVACRIVFNARHAIFGGHFPGQPVVPGVCTMEIVKELLQQELGQSLILRSTGNVKFLQLITPDVQPTAKISWKKTEEGYAVNATFSKDTNAIFKMNSNYEVVA